MKPFQFGISSLVWLLFLSALVLAIVQRLEVVPFRFRGVFIVYMLVLTIWFVFRGPVVVRAVRANLRQLRDIRTKREKLVNDLTDADANKKDNHSPNDSNSP